MVLTRTPRRASSPGSSPYLSPWNQSSWAAPLGPRMWSFSSPLPFPVWTCTASRVPQGPWLWGAYFRERGHYRGGSWQPASPGMRALAVTAPLGVLCHPLPQKAKEKGVGSRQGKQEEERVVLSAEQALVSEDKALPAWHGNPHTTLSLLPEDQGLLPFLQESSLSLA